MIETRVEIEVGENMFPNKCLKKLHKISSCKGRVLILWFQLLKKKPDKYDDMPSNFQEPMKLVVICKLVSSNVQ